MLSHLVCAVTLPAVGQGRSRLIDIGWNLWTSRNPSFELRGGWMVVGRLPAVLAVVVLAPIGGYGAVHFRDRLLLLVSEARAYLLLRRDERVREALEARRSNLRRDLLALVEQYQETHGARR